MAKPRNPLPTLNYPERDELIRIQEYILSQCAARKNLPLNKFINCSNINSIINAFNVNKERLSQTTGDAIKELIKGSGFELEYEEALSAYIQSPNYRMNRLTLVFSNEQIEDIGWGFFRSQKISIIDFVENYEYLEIIINKHVINVMGSGLLINAVHNADIIFRYTNLHARALLNKRIFSTYLSYIALYGAYAAFQLEDTAYLSVMVKHLKYAFELDKNRHTSAFLKMGEHYLEQTKIRILNPHYSYIQSNQVQAFAIKSAEAYVFQDGKGLPNEFAQAFVPNANAAIEYRLRGRSMKFQPCFLGGKTLSEHLDDDIERCINNNQYEAAARLSFSQGQGLLRDRNLEKAEEKWNSGIKYLEQLDNSNPTAAANGLVLEAQIMYARNSKLADGLIPKLKQASKIFSSAGVESQFHRTKTIISAIQEGRIL